MNYKSIITNLYYMLIHADGHVNEREITLGHQMIYAEGISDIEFESQLDSLKSKNSSVLFTESVMGLKTLDRKRQIRVIAWLCVVANADGFMDRTEWQFIYKLYHKELDLPLDEIMAVQKELTRLSRDRVISPSIQVAA